MKIEIDIPKEFEEHFKQDRFEDTLRRLRADAHLIAGNYEKETVIMLIKAFQNAKIISDTTSCCSPIFIQDPMLPDDFGDYLCSECKSTIYSSIPGPKTEKPSICPYCNAIIDWWNIEIKNADRQ